jgi:hypothetical protein
LRRSCRVLGGRRRPPSWQSRTPAREGRASSRAGEGNDRDRHITRVCGGRASSQAAYGVMYPRRSGHGMRLMTDERILFDLGSMAVARGADADGSDPGPVRAVTVAGAAGRAGPRRRGWRTNDPVHPRPARSAVHDEGAHTGRCRILAGWGFSRSSAVEAAALPAAEWRSRRARRPK